MVAELAALERAQGTEAVRRAVLAALKSMQRMHQIGRDDIGTLEERMGRTDHRSDTAITPEASPYSYQNTTPTEAQVSVSGGTISAIQQSYDASNWRATGMTAGMFNVPPMTYLKVTYTVVPTMRLLQ